MEQNKYYAPNLEDLYLGYEYEVKDSVGIWKSGKFPEIIEDHWELKEFEDTYMKAAHAIIRTKYLNKNDIESLGWVGFMADNLSDEFCSYKKDDFILHLYKASEIIKIYDIESRLYKGSCPSINELKKIMKWVGIQ